MAVSLRVCGLLTGAAVAVGGASNTRAAFTEIQAPFGGEDSHAEIFSNLYGGTFSADGVNFTNGSITAERIDDDDDHFFSSDLPIRGTAKVTFADFDQEFGIFDDDGGPFQSVFNVNGYGYDVTGSAVIDVDDEFAVGRDGPRGTFASSEPSFNPSGVDRVVSYRLLGLDGPGPVWAWFFEDQGADVADFDFQDLVVEGRVVPTPAAAAAGLVMLSGALLRRRARADA